MNTNLNRLKDLQVNHFTQLVLAVEARVAVVLDANAKNGGKLKSIKPQNGELFVSGKFLNQNRWIVLAVQAPNSLSIWTVEVLSLKVASKTVISNIKNARIESSLDGETIAVL